MIQMNKEEGLKQIKQLRRFSIFVGCNSFLLGMLAVFGGIVFSRDANGDMTLFSLVCGVIGGLLWHTGYKSFMTAKECKGFGSVEEYIEHLKAEAAAKANKRS